MAVSERTFGVEIECTYGRGPTKQDLTFGAQDREQQRRKAIADFSANSDLKEWGKSIGIDGSGIEIRSPVLKGAEGIEELSAVFDFLIEKESSVTNQDGMHVHHGAKDYAEDSPAVLRLVKSWAAFTPTINKLVATRRRKSNMCYPTWNDKLITNLEKALSGDFQTLATQYEQALNSYYNGVGGPPLPIARPYAVAGRGALNINNIWVDRHYSNGKQTIEIRLSEGLMDRDCAVSWVKFGQAFIDSIKDRQRTLACSQTLESLFRAINLDAEAATVLDAKSKNRGAAIKKAAPGKIADGIKYDESEDDE